MDKKNKSGGVVHVRLQSPLNIRKNILGAAIDTANVLKTYDELRRIRNRKEEVVESFNSLFDDVKDLFENIEGKYLPELPLQEQEFRKVEKKDTKKEIVKHTDNEVERLKTELEDIERRLRNL